MCFGKDCGHKATAVAVGSVFLNPGRALMRRGIHKELMLQIRTCISFSETTIEFIDQTSESQSPHSCNSSTKAKFAKESDHCAAGAGVAADS